MLGGFSEGKEPNEEEFEMVTGFKNDIQQRVNKEFEFFIPVRITTQVVAGLNYKVKIQVGE